MQEKQDAAPLPLSSQRNIACDLSKLIAMRFEQNAVFLWVNRHQNRLDLKASGQNVCDAVSRRSGCILFLLMQAAALAQWISLAWKKESNQQQTLTSSHVQLSLQYLDYVCRPK